MTVLSFFVKKKSIPPAEKRKNIACVITGYKDVDITVPCVESLLSQKYMKYHVYLVLDHCGQAVQYPVSNERLTVLLPQPFLNSKLKSIKYAIDHFVENHEDIVIFDPDNLAPAGYLDRLNDYVWKYEAVQTRRTAKNSASKLARLDAIGEMLHNFTDKRNMFKLGSSATISGSGMVVKTSDFLDFYSSEPIRSKLDGVILGEDKMLQNFLVSRGIQIAYAEDILLFDEKVNTKHQVRRQRIRWLNTYFENVKDSASLIWQGIKNLNWNQSLFGFYNLYPPLFLVLLVSFLAIAVNFYIMPKGALLLGVGVLIFCVNFILTLYFSKAPGKYYLTLLYIPFFILQQIYSLLHLKKAKVDFLVTGSSETVSVKDIERKNRDQAR